MTVEGCEISGRYDGALLQYCIAPKVRWNEFIGGGRSLKLWDCNGEWVISHNKFTQSNNAVSISDSDGWPGRARFFNNSIRYIHPLSFSNAYLLSIGYSDKVDIWNNTIEFDTPSGYTHHHALYLNLSDSCTIYNNNFVKLGGGKALRILNSWGVKSDYNNFYSPDGEIAYNDTTLADWQATTNLDSHSVSVDPGFNGTSIDSMLPSNPLLINAGLPLPGLFDDIDGNPRNILAPWIGSQEIPSAPILILGSDTTYCDSAWLDALNPGSSYLWSTGDTTQRIRVSSSGLYWVQATNAVGSDIDSIQITILNTPTSQLPDSLDLCQGDSVSLDPLSVSAAYTWSTGDTTPQYLCEHGWHLFSGSGEWEL